MRFPYIIIISRIEDIPTRPDLPRFVNIEALDQSSPSQAAANNVESQTKKETSGYTQSSLSRLISVEP